MIRFEEEKDHQLLEKLYKEIFATNISFNADFKYIKVYEIDNQVVGFIDYSVIYERIEINYIYVLDSYQRRGIATELLNDVIKTTNDILNITLEVNVNNQKAINFYQKNGFKIASKRERYYKNGDDAYLMIRVI